MTHGARKNDDLKDVQRKLEELAREGRVQDLVALVIELLTRVREDNTSLQVRLHKALRALYGRSSEKVSADQLSLLFEGLDEPVPAGAQAIVDDAQADKDSEVEQPAEPPKPPRGKKGRSPLPPDLPRELRFIRVPDELRTCTICGRPKDRIGSIRSELLEFVPAHFKVIELEREKLACGFCECGVVTAPDPKPMDKGRPGPGLIAHIIVSKCQDSLPLYRQCQIYARSGVTLSASTVGEWFGFGCDVVVPIARHIVERVLASLVVRADDTGIRVLDRAHPKGVKRGHMWGYVGDGDLVAFDYTPTWEAKEPLKFLERFEGYLQGDGYAGFKTSLERERGDPIIPEHRRLGCGMHVRRKFEQAADAGDARGAIALAFFRKLYDIERTCKHDLLAPEQRKQRRDQQSQPILRELYDWIHDVHARLVPDGKLFTATRYAINQEQAWRRCFDDGRFEIDNGEVERQLRRVAIGRKNYLFAGSDKGAQRLAAAYTLLATCHMHAVDPLAYLTDVIDKIQNGWPQSRIDELVPDAWLGKREPAAEPTAAE